ncbi:hypothetical protein NT6N_23020 [Oceaniferula spumae]|uniref:DUF7133 domain-containing protein n=1 Tax=Oceaniferula spumae TaxID=2979115 RepID=A0AAT9FMX2_9BACT
MPLIKNTTLALLLVTLCGAALAQNITDSYRIEDIALPKNVPPEVGAVQFDSEGTLYVALRRGDILMAKPTADPKKFEWKQFASGFHNACGMEVIKPRHIVVSQMPELTEVRDTDGDGVADSYTTLTDVWGVSGNYHETNEICPDGNGGYYIAVGTASHNGPTFHHLRGEYSKIGRRGRNFSGVPWKGWVMHYAKDGTVTPFAKGFRMHNGIMRDSNGELWCGDNQGDWRATTPFYHLKKDAFYGHPSSLVWDKDWPKGKDPLKMPLKEINAMRTRAAVLLPHKEINRSASEPVEIPENFGPFAGQILLPDNNSNRISRIMLDKVNGEYQGSCTHFINGHGLRSGNNRAVFTADGKTLYVGQTARGWGKPAEGLQRITWLGKTPFDIKQIKLTKTGFDLNFTKEVKLLSGSLVKLRSFRYEDKWSYGGPQLDKRDEAVSSQRSEGKMIHLDVPKLEPGRVYHIKISGLKSKDGTPLLNQDFYYTLNQLVKN